jgi:hypothetical protein
MASLGALLLKTAHTTSDYVLYVTEPGKKPVKIFAHRCVLAASSPKLAELIKADNYFDLTLSISPNSLQATIQLIQYMYLHDLSRITRVSEVKELCAQLRMSTLFYKLGRIAPKESPNVLQLRTTPLAAKSQNTSTYSLRRQAKRTRSARSYG